ncbi:MAG TPA: DNA ligase D [Bryobacteraceae bacterium]|nr:DNA ligase D [Bryobacteraceae bacterium]
MPETVRPMLAQPATRPPGGKSWLYEVKWDGVRALCHIEAGALRMYSRNGNSYDRQFPELAVVPHRVRCQNAILDGEIVVVDDKGRSSFELIQPRIHQTDANSIAHLARRTPVKLFLFDLLYYDGYDLRGVPIERRKEILEGIVDADERIMVSQAFDVPGEQMLDAAARMNLEGIMAKRRGSLYEDRRSDCWLKIKIHNQQEFVICGFTHGERDTFSSLVLGVCDSGEFVWAGNVGTGFDDKTLRDLHSRLQQLVTSKSPFRSKPAMLRSATWVEPVLVCECKFTEWTREGRLRAPVYLGLRTDKEPSECLRDRVDAGEPVEKPASPSKRAVRKKAPPAETHGPLFAATAKEVSLEIDGRNLRFTNLGKIWFPKDRVTKRDVLNYYDAVSELILPHLRDRPLSLKRYHNGIHEDFFFQKNIPETYPDWLRTVPIPSEHRGEDINFVVADNRATLLYLTNLGCIDQNPWMSRISSLDNPDFVLIDLDPVDCAFAKIVEAALLVRDVLEELGLQGYPKTTGGDGMHVIVPLEPVYSYDQARSFAEIVSQLVLARKPDLFTTPRSVEKRKKNRVYFDYMQLSFSKTISAPYVVRAYDGAPVATPLEWSEVKAGLTPGQFNIGNAVARFRERGDLFAGVLNKLQRIEPALQRVAKLVER